MRSTWITTTIALLGAGCGGAALDPDEPIPPPSIPPASRGAGPVAVDRPASISEQRVEQDVEEIATGAPPVPLWCGDPSFFAGDLIVGGERLRILPTCPTLGYRLPLLDAEGATADPELRLDRDERAQAEGRAGPRGAPRAGDPTRGGP
ncbi:MAG TPA: hypothetical protein VKZ63_00530 [Kofleriaceae bacterium]|nr:hypothetical protein [Kofleriaceae bacterium]